MPAGDAGMGRREFCELASRPARALFEHRLMSPAVYRASLQPAAGISPDFGLLDKEPIMIKNESGETSSQVPSTYLSLQQPRCPSTFVGDGSQGAQKWLKEYKRIAEFNRWDDTMYLAIAVSFPEGTARK
ncbi:hypothetical protein LAZ67_2001562 [Cordylochernes scorpioides]|uniref:Uncharacterized protein n=1 Tax=Cordylochernes scorpioides TaxID=51811 RepID=A0ABY6K1J9_9ARAC|nr:hypothetical protein LAZ67_2001562 [Cordylochernes scorpioides]